MNVNLIPDEKVHDIYQVVADKVNVVLHKDALEGTADDFKKDKKTGEYVLDSKGKKCIKYGTNGSCTHVKSSVRTVSSVKSASVLS